ncbi:MAG: class I SAM-dependent methyltransferase [Actinomycetaceae bacterium]|nr:class I SAM-dependent methyltransferase [Actinomycetaceae bacterium]
MGKAKFDGYTNQYDEWFMANENVFNSELKLLVKALGDLSGKRVLSVGCGSGLFESNLDHRGIEGVEPSADMAQIARKRGMEVQVATFEDADLEQDAYDVIYFNGSSTYIADLEVAYRKAHACLKPGGRLVLLDVPKESAYALMYLLAASVGSYDHEFLAGVMPPMPYPLELVTAGYWHTSESKWQVLRDLGMRDFESYQTLVNNPVYTNDEVEDVVDGYRAGGYVALVAHK